MGRGSGSIRPHLAVLLLLTGVLAGLLLRTPVPSVPTPLPQGEVGERIAAALPAPFRGRGNRIEHGNKVSSS